MPLPVGVNPIANETFRRLREQVPESETSYCWSVRPNLAFCYYAILQKILALNILQVPTAATKAPQVATPQDSAGNGVEVQVLFQAFAKSLFHKKLLAHP